MSMPTEDELQAIQQYVDQHMDGGIDIHTLENALEILQGAGIVREGVTAPLVLAAIAAMQGSL